MATTSQVLARLRRRKQDIQSRYKTTVAATLNEYGKVVQESFDRGLVSRANLVAKREERENKQQSLREQFAAATSNVLSAETLDFLKQQSNIAAPTLTSIFAGYESARADRANRFEKLLDRRQEGLTRVQAADELAFRDQAAQRQQQLAARSNIIQSGLAAENVIFKSDSDTINTEADFAQADAKILAAQEEAQRARAAASALEQQRSTLRAAEQTVANKQAIARINLEIEAKQKQAELSNSRAVALEQTRQSFALKRDQASNAFALQRDQTNNKFQRELAGINNAADIQQATISANARTKGASGKSTSAADRINTELSLISGRYEGGTISKTNPLVSEEEIQASKAPVEVAPITTRTLDADGNAVNETVVPGQVVPLDTPPEDTPPITDTVDEAPVSPLSAVGTEQDFFAQVTADQEDAVAAATASLQQVVAESMPDEVTNLGETPTVDQLASLVDSQLEENDERVASLLKGIREATAANTTEIG